MLFYHLADIHLGACPDRGHPWSQQRAQQIYDSFYKVLERAHEEQADFVFICGDLFHRQPLKRELKELDYYFAKAAPVKIVIIAGIMIIYAQSLHTLHGNGVIMFSGLPSHHAR